MAWMFWLWEKQGESKLGNRVRGGKEVLADKPRDFENPARQQHD